MGGCAQAPHVIECVMITVADCHRLPIGTEVRVVRVSTCVMTPTRVGDVWHYWGPSDTGAARFWLPGVRRMGRAAAEDWRFELV